MVSRKGDHGTDISSLSAVEPLQKRVRPLQAPAMAVHKVLRLQEAVEDPIALHNVGAGIVPLMNAVGGNPPAI